MVALICTGCGSDWPSLTQSLIAIGAIVGAAIVIAFILLYFGIIG